MEEGEEDQLTSQRPLAFPSRPTPSLLVATMFRSAPTTALAAAPAAAAAPVSNSGPTHNDLQSSAVSGALLVFASAVLLLLLQSAAAVSTASTATRFDYFSASDLASSSVSDYPPSLLHNVDRVLEDLARQHFDDLLSHRVSMIDSSAMQLKPFAFSTSSSSSSSSFADMPSPRRVADPTGVYGQQDAAEGDVAAAAAGRKKPFPPHVSNGFRTAQSKRSASRSDSTPALPLLLRSPPPGFRRPARPCSPSSSAASGIIGGGKAIDYASFAAAIVTLVININNNVNNRNNNNNNFNLNAVSSSNVASNSNTNIANQLNIQPPGGRRRRSRRGILAGCCRRRSRCEVVGYAALVALTEIRSIQVARKKERKKAFH